MGHQSGIGAVRPTSFYADAQNGVVVAGAYSLGADAGFGADLLPGTPYTGGGAAENAFLARLGTTIGLASRPGLLAGAAETPLQAYPNPVAGQGLRLKLTQPVNGTAAVRVQLRSALGQVVYETTVPANQLDNVVVPTQPLAAGLYVLQAQAGGRTFTAKVGVEAR